MKKIKRLLVFLTLIAVSFHSCNDEVAPVKETKSIIQPKSDGRGSSNARTTTTACSVNGPLTAAANHSETYTFSTDISNPAITWSVVSGAITLVSGQGTTTATFRFESGFSGGSIQALGSNQEVCSETIAISSSSSSGGTSCPPAPTITATLMSGPGEPTDYRFKATLTSGVTYNWYVNGVLIESSSSSIFDWYLPCKVVNTIKCTFSKAGCASSFSNSITRTGGCIRT